MEVTAWTVLVFVLGGMGGVVAFQLIRRVLPKRGERGSDVAFVGNLVASIAIAALIVCAIPGTAFHEYLWPAPAAVPPGVPVVQITVGQKGYVLATVEDEYKIPRTLISGADVYVSTQQPVPRAAWIANAKDNTSSAGSVQVTVQGVTSGLVYVTAYKAGYYSDYATTTVPGPETPSVPAAVKLENVGSWSVSVTENSTNLTFDGENIVENTTTSTTGYFTLNIATSGAFTALKDIQLLEIRGDAYTARGAAIAPVVLKDGGTIVSVIGDPTLSSAATGGYNFTGNLSYGQVIQIKVTVSVSSAGTGTLARIDLDDLLGSAGYLNETGVVLKTLYIKAVA